MSAPCSITGLILAGGKSTRMGRDKAALVLVGETLLDRARRTLREAGAEPVIVLGRPDEADGWTDPPGDAGPGIALAAALTRLEEAGPFRALVIPVDMPGLTPDCLKALIRSGHSAHYQGERLPLYVAPDAPCPIPETVRSLGDVVRSVGAQALSRPADEGILANINTPDAFAGLSGVTGPD